MEPVPLGQGRACLAGLEVEGDAGGGVANNHLDGVWLRWLWCLNSLMIRGLDKHGFGHGLQEQFPQLLLGKGCCLSFSSLDFGVLL